MFILLPFLFISVFCLSAVWALISDIKTRTIPDECSLLICILSVGLGGFGLKRLCLAVLVLFVSSLILGMGDAKIFASMTLVFGYEIYKIVLCAYCICALYCISKLICRELKLGDRIAFAPFFVPPAITAALFLFIDSN